MTNGQTERQKLYTPWHCRGIITDTVNQHNVSWNNIIEQNKSTSSGVARLQTMETLYLHKTKLHINFKLITRTQTSYKFQVNHLNPTDPFAVISL